MTDKETWNSLFVTEKKIRRFLGEIDTLVDKIDNELDELFVLLRIAGSRAGQGPKPPVSEAEVQGGDA